MLIEILILVSFRNYCTTHLKVLVYNSSIGRTSCAAGFNLSCIDSVLKIK